MNLKWTYCNLLSILPKQQIEKIEQLYIYWTIYLILKHFLPFFVSVPIHSGSLIRFGKIVSIISI